MISFHIIFFHLTGDRVSHLRRVREFYPLAMTVCKLISKLWEIPCRKISYI